MGGSFSIQKFVLQIFAIIDDTLVMNFRKNLQYDFPKNEGGGSKTVWNFSENSSVSEGKGVPYHHAFMNTPWELQCDSAMTASVHRGETLYFLKMKETDGWHPLDSMDAQTGPFKVNHSRD